ncbi:signal recognition particle protein [Deinococcus lacus]|uniref:Signal recognition particle protein n=1 Tax=Deinococcus lacus TaxID=392561 RepID=A0ABW1Y9L2_9DEIO
MFETLGNKLQDILEKVGHEKALTEDQVKATMREIRMALLEADVNFGVAKDFVAKVSAQAVGQKLSGSLDAGQTVIKLVHDELVEMLGGDKAEPTLVEGGRNVWFMVGLQGAGKTTSTGKLASLYKKQGKRILLVAADTQRPAARDQLEVLARQVGVPVLKVEDGEAPSSIRSRIDAQLAQQPADLVIVDTAGRLQIDEALMGELAALSGELKPTETLLVVDAMTGQEALNVARAFDERVRVSGLIMTKLDGDARGGAALSARSVTGKPIYFAGVSEKLSGLEPFYPDRIAGRILGMGDVMGLIERAEQADIKAMDAKKAGEFDLDDLLLQLRQIRRMGPIADLIKLIPGMSRALPEGFTIEDKQIQRIDAMISAMTLEERRNPKIVGASRRERIARGSGHDVQDVNKLLKMHEQMKEMMKMLQKMSEGEAACLCPRASGLPKARCHRLNNAFAGAWPLLLCVPFWGGEGPGLFGAVAGQANLDSCLTGCVVVWAQVETECRSLLRTWRSGRAGGAAHPWRERKGWPDHSAILGLPCAAPFFYGGFDMTLANQYHALPKLLKVAEVANFTGTHERTVRRWIRDGRLPAVESPEGVRVPRRSLWRFLGLDLERSA